MNRRGFFSRLAGLVLVPALARMRPEPVRPVLVSWRNYTAPYTNMDKAEMVARMRRAARKITWIPPATQSSELVVGFLMPLDDTGRNWQYIPPDRRS